MYILQNRLYMYFNHSRTANDDVIKWKHFPPYWPFVRRIHRSPVNSLHKGQWCRALMFSLICFWINDWVNNGEAGNLRRYRIHYEVIVTYSDSFHGCYCYCYYEDPILVLNGAMFLGRDLELMMETTSVTSRYKLESYIINSQSAGKSRQSIGRGSLSISREVQEYGITIIFCQFININIRKSGFISVDAVEYMICVIGRIQHGHMDLWMTLYSI